MVLIYKLYLNLDRKTTIWVTLELKITIFKRRIHIEGSNVKRFLLVVNNLDFLKNWYIKWKAKYLFKIRFGPYVHHSYVDLPLKCNVSIGFQVISMLMNE